MESRLGEALAGHLSDQELPDGSSLSTVSDEGLMAAAAVLGWHPRQVACRCLSKGIWPQRFGANRGALTTQDQISLLESRALLVGAGGLGGVAALALARLGVGRLTVCDGDQFEESNLNRQWLANLARLGQNKARCAAAEVALINPLVVVSAREEWISPENLADILAGAQVVIDCLDNMEARYWLQEAAAKAGLPFVHGALAGHEGMVMTVAPGEPGLKGLYGPRPVPKKDSAEVLMGTPTLTPLAIATLQANEAVQLLLGRRGLGPGQVLHLDLALPSLEILRLA